jgi:hypothetical protein
MCLLWAFGKRKITEEKTFTTTPCLVRRLLASTQSRRESECQKNQEKRKTHRTQLIEKESEQPGTASQVLVSSSSLGLATSEWQLKVRSPAPGPGCQF